MEIKTASKKAAFLGALCRLENRYPDSQEKVSAAERIIKSAASIRMEKNALPFVAPVAGAIAKGLGKSIWAAGKAFMKAPMGVQFGVPAGISQMAKTPGAAGRNLASQAMREML